jgi:small-conductance mechanosensitive channel
MDLMEREWLGLTNAQWLETAVAAAVLAAVITFALMVAAVAPRVVHYFTRASERQLDAALGRAVRWPFVLVITILATRGAIGMLSYVEDERGRVGRVAVILTVLVVSIAVRRVLVLLVEWQAQRPGGGKLHPGTVPLIRRGITILVLAAGALTIIDAMGVAISPLLAGLGIGGIAVALAVQPLLSNIFASSYMLSDSSIRIGDWIEVEGGPVGSVDDIGWRATRIRSFDNNIVVVPNATLANSTVTNYSLTSLEADLRVVIGVAYEEDLERVEEVCVDEMTKLRDEWETSVKDYEPVVRFQVFGDSNIDVLLKLRAQTWGDSFFMRHILMKRIHARFRAEGITINYPARRLFLQEGDVEGLDRIRRPGDS